MLVSGLFMCLGFVRLGFTYTPMFLVFSICALQSSLLGGILYLICCIFLARCLGDMGVFRLFGVDLQQHVTLFTRQDRN